MFNLYESRPNDGPLCSSKSEFSQNSLEDLPSIWNPAKHKLTKFVFPSETKRVTTTARPHLVPTESSGWNRNTPKTTKQTSAWNREPANESTTTKKSDLLPWMEDVLNEFATTRKTNVNENHRLTTMRTTTPKPIETTTINSFWSEWSLTNPTVFNSELTTARSRQTTTTELFGEPSTTPTESLLPWMEDVLNEHSTAANSDVIKLIRPSPPEVTGMPSWMHNVLNEHSTTRIPRPSQLVTSEKPQLTFGDGTLTFSVGNGDLHLPTENRYIVNRHRNVFFTHQQILVELFRIVILN